MNSLLLRGALGVALIVSLAVGGAGATQAQGVDAVIKHRQDTMKQQSSDLKTIKAYMDGTADQAKAETAVADLGKTSQEIPSLFPADSAKATPGPNDKYWPKPTVWSDNDKFVAAAKTLSEKTEALSAAIKTGDKTKVAAAFGDAGKNGCGGCHKEFREEIKH